MFVLGSVWMLMLKGKCPAFNDFPILVISKQFTFLEQPYHQASLIFRLWFNIRKYAY